MKTYFLWLEPTGKTRELLASTIAHLSQEYDGPLFDPHVTLLGDITGQEGKLLHTTEKLAHILAPFDLTLTIPAFQDQSFQCVFMRVKETSTLLEAHTLARKVFHKADAPPYMPHLSLLYGSYTKSAKEQIIGNISTSLSVQFKATAVTLFRDEGNNPTNWRKLQTFGFGAHDEQGSSE